MDSGLSVTSLLKMRRRLLDNPLIAILVTTLVTEILVTEIPIANAQTLVDALTLSPGENNVYAVVIDGAGAFGYFATRTSPGKIVKVDVSTFSRVDALTLNAGENETTSAVIGPAGHSVQSSRVKGADVRSDHHHGHIRQDVCLWNNSRIPSLNPSQ